MSGKRVAPPVESSGGSARFVHVIAVAACLAAGVLFLRGTKDVGLMGWDTYPLIVESRVESVADFVGNFTEKLMDGRYQSAFYRPLTNLSVALDFALWGLNPFGYQLTDAVLWAGTCVSLYFLLCGLTEGASRFAPFFGLAFFLFHPSHAEVVPVPARRPEAMCAMFMAMSLIWQLSSRSLRMRRPPIVPALWALLAMLSKETALILPGLSFLAVYLYSPKTNRKDRARHAWVALVPHLVVLAVILGVRLAILGGIGGHRAISIGDTLMRLPPAVLLVVRLVAGAHIPPESLVPMGVLGAILVVALGAVVVLTTPGQMTSRERADRPSGSGSGAILGVAWLMLVCLLYASGDRINPWYLFQPAFASAILIGMMAAWLTREVARRSGPARYAALCCLALTGALLTWQARYSPVFRPGDDWERASVASEVFLEELKTRLAASTPGSVIPAPPLPVWIERTGASGVFGGMILWDYSVQAWVDLQTPERPARVVWAHASTSSHPRPDQVLVVLDKKLEGYDQMNLGGRRR